jgi:hypothetical protein
MTKMLLKHQALTVSVTQKPPILNVMHTATSSQSWSLSYRNNFLTKHNTKSQLWAAIGSNTEIRGEHARPSAACHQAIKTLKQNNVTEDNQKCWLRNAQLALWPLSIAQQHVGYPQQPVHAPRLTEITKTSHCGQELFTWQCVFISEIFFARARLLWWKTLNVLMVGAFLCWREVAI